MLGIRSREVLGRECRALSPVATDCCLQANEGEVLWAFAKLVCGSGLCLTCKDASDAPKREPSRWYPLRDEPSAGVSAAALSGHTLTRRSSCSSLQRISSLVYSAIPESSAPRFFSHLDGCSTHIALLLSMVDASLRQSLCLYGQVREAASSSCLCINEMVICVNDTLQRFHSRRSEESASRSR